MHDNPDPDAIASAWCITKLLEERTKIKVKACAGGAVVRAENVHMIKLLSPPIQLIDNSHDDLTVFEYGSTGAILVDCGATSTNHLLARCDLPLVGVIDHHQQHDPDSGNISFVDVQTDAAACATLTSNYLIEQGIRPSEELATAVWYALRTETSAYQSKYTSKDREILLWATEFGSPALLAEIENAPLSPRHFFDLKNAIDSTLVYENVAFCWVRNLQSVEVVGQVADLIIRCEGVEQVLCGTSFNEQAYVSVRTTPTGGDATQLLMTALKGLGCGGGHKHRAGGKVEKLEDSSNDNANFRKKVLARWLSANELNGDAISVPIVDLCMLGKGKQENHDGK
jgi:nanoRNase/pAp phosphatase (c-di-AMP/oligoRNAs hydrolase)